MKETFKAYIDSARDQFVQEIRNYSVKDYLKLRTESVSFLIAYDQLVDKLPILLDCHKPDAEKFISHYCAVDDIEEIRYHTWTTMQVIDLLDDFILTIKVQNQNNSLVL